MAAAFPESQCKTQTDMCPLLMEHSSSSRGQEHIINITKGDVASTSISHDSDHHDLDQMRYDNRPSTSMHPPISQPPPLSPTAPNPRNVSAQRRGDNNNRPRRGPLSSGWWISIELLVNMSQIVAAIIVLSLSRHEKPHTPLFTWVIGYTAGCIATLPHLYWRYIHHNGQGSEQEPAHSRQSSYQENPSESTPYTVVSFSRSLEGGNRQRANRLGQNLVIVGPRLNALVDHFKMALDCFFAVWFVVGNVWVFGGHSSPEDSPNLYRLCIAFLTFSCTGYAMPFILCATICCCLPCVISVLGYREDLYTRGATTESINALPTYKFKSNRSRNHGESESSSESTCEGGSFAPGTDKERIVSAEDAVCCICLARYLDNDELRELPCTHFFHAECVDKWLAINALCPLCKSEVANASGASAFFSSSTRRLSNWRTGNGADARV